MKMKRLKKFVSLLSAVALCVLLPNANALTVSAAEPVTYYVKHVDDEWKFQTGGWSNSEYNRDLYYMFEEIKDGDIVVVDNNGYEKFVTLNFSKRLSNLTIVKDSHAIVSATGIDQVHALSGSSTAITGDVNNAALFDDAGVTFHSNVNTLTLIDTKGESTGTATVAGTAGHVIRKTDTDYIYFEIFNVAQGQLNIEWGSLKTDAAHYSTTPTATQAPQAPAAQPQASTPQQSTSSGEYDDVPKTGESNVIVWLLGISVLCLLGKRALNRA